jgi:hypothetical protein
MEKGREMKANSEKEEKGSDGGIPEGKTIY